MRFFAAGLFTETNTFSPVPTATEDFVIQRAGQGAEHPHPAPGGDIIDFWRARTQARGDEFIFSLMAFAEPSGVILRTAYEDLRDEILRDLRASMPVDVVLLNLHGAMVADGYDDCEADLLRCVRQIAGPSTIIAAELDLHCLLTEEKVAAADLLITYKEYPHTDVNARAQELFDLAIRMRLGEIRPTMALFDCRMIGLYPTTVDPLRKLLVGVRGSEHDNVLSVSFSHGFPFADVPHNSAKLLVIADADPGLAQRKARQLGLMLYAHRREIGFDTRSVPLEQALQQAVSRARGPIVIADQSDNPGSGAPGDATFALRWLLTAGVTDAAAGIFYDPEVVKLAQKVGVGRRLQVRLGGKTGAYSGEPVDLNVEVLSLRQAYTHAFPQQSGPAWSFQAGDVVALRSGTLDLVVSSRRCQCFSPGIFTDLGIDPAQKRLLIPKSTQHFVGAFAPIAAEIIYMDGPGAASPNPRQIAYMRLDTSKLFPWQEDPLGVD